MPQDFRDFLSAQSGLNQARASGTTETAETQAVGLTVSNAGPSTRRPERSFDGSYSEHGYIVAVVALRIFPHGLELETQTIANRGDAGLHGLSVECADRDCCLREIAPLQGKDFACSHSSVNRADQDRSQVFDASSASGQQSGFFFERQDADALALIGNRDNRVTLSKRTTHDPSFALCDIEQPAQRSEFAVDAGDRSTFASSGFSFEPFGLVGLEIGIRDRTEGAIRKDFVDSLSVALDRRSRTKAGHFTLIHIDRIDGVPFEIPLHDISETRARVVVTGDVKNLPFLESFAESVSSFGLILAGAPESFALPVFHPGNAGVDITVADNDLDLMVAGHLLPSVLYQPKQSVDIKSNRERDCETEGGKNQPNLKGIDVLSWFGQDGDGELNLTSNQKAPRSSRGECNKNLSNPYAPKKSDNLLADLQPVNLYVRFNHCLWRHEQMPRVKTFLYAVRMLIPNHDPQPIKIGFSSSPDKRRLSYNSGPYPCEWLGVWPGTSYDELQFHSEFHELNRAKGLIGEWFLPDKRFMRTVNKKIQAYRKNIQRDQERAVLIEAKRREREAVDAVKHKEMRVRAAQILDDAFGSEAIEEIQNVTMVQ